MDAQFDKFLAKYDPAIAKRGREVLAAVRARLPGAVELVYDNYNALVVGFGATERTSEAIVSVALYPRWVTLFFLQGAELPDPEGVLQGSGKIVRSVRLSSAEDLDKPAIRALLAEAVARSETPFDAKSEGRMIIRSISAKQRPRRPR